MAQTSLNDSHLKRHMRNDDAALTESFYQAILRADRWELLRNEVPPEFATTEANEFDCVLWMPVRQLTHATELEKIYSTIPGRLPKLFEECLMSFGWLTVEVGDIALFPHQPLSGLDVFVDCITRDEELFPALFEQRYVQFGRPASGSYDAVCFDLNRTKKRDCPVVVIDHESVLVEGRPRVTREIASSFRAWIERLPM